MLTQNQKLLSILVHAASFFCLIFVALIVFLVSKDEYVKRNAKEALVFQIAVVIALIISSILSIVFIGIPLLFAVTIVNIIFPIMAIIAVTKGTEYNYPLTSQFTSKIK